MKGLETSLKKIKINKNVMIFFLNLFSKYGDKTTFKITLLQNFIIKSITSLEISPIKEKEPIGNYVGWYHLDCQLQHMSVK
jgi:hypothetical protein